LRHWLFFSPYRYGHHVDSIRYQLAYLQAQGRAVRITYLVEQGLLEEQWELVALAAQVGHNGSRVEFVALQPDEFAEMEASAIGEQDFAALMRGAPAATSRAATEWKLFCRYAQRLEVDAACLLYGDHFLPAVVAGLSAPCPFVMLHYQFWLVHELYATVGGDVPPEVRRKLRQGEMVLKRALLHPLLEGMLTHDFVVVEQLGRLAPGKLRFIPERAPQLQPNHQAIDALRHELGLDPARQLFLIFGDLTARKGIYELLAALELLPPEDAAQLALLLVGRTPGHLLARLEAALESARLRTRAQIVMRQGFVPEENVLTYFVLADVILAVYPQHVASSGVLVNAAVVQRPVLSTDFGLMAHMTRRYGLGLTVDATSPQAIAAGLARFLLQPHADLFQPEKAQGLAAASTPNAYAAALFSELGLLEKAS
jgi:glycosyltransferase involved in cell wall biosynthesis